MNKIELWKKLEREAITTTSNLDDIVITPWYLKLLMGFAGWLGALFILGSLGLILYSFMDDYPVVGLITGVLVSFLSYILFKKDVKNEFFNQLILAISITGQGILIYSIIDLFEDNSRVILLLIFLIQAVLFIIINNFILKLLSVILSLSSLLILISSFNLYYLVPGLLLAGTYYVWSREFKILLKPKLIQSLGYSLTTLSISTIFAGGYIWQRSSKELIGPLELPVISSIAFWVNLTLIALIYFVLLREQFNLRFIMAIFVSIIIAAIGYKVPGLIVVLPIIILGFYHRNYFLLWVGVIGTIVYLSLYYYNMEITLLIKSVSLIIGGAILLITRVILKRKGILCQKS